MSTSSLSSKEKLARLRAELAESSEPSKQNYLTDLDDCGVKWKNGRYRCNAVGCPRCTRKVIGQQQKKARTFFADMVGSPTNAEMALLTVVGDGTRDLDEVTGNIEAMYKATHYRVGRQSSSSRWNGFAAWGYYEIDAVGAEHLPLLGSERRALLEKVAPVYMGQNGPTWVPTYHALVHIGRLGIAEVQNEFARTWPVPGQVHLEPFEIVRSVDANIDRLVKYGLKSACQIEVPTQKPNGEWGKAYVPWPLSWKADYFTWLHQRRNGFEYLGFSISPVSPKMIRHVTVQDDLTVLPYVEVEPMPILF
jgi:hypothetical protein